MGRTELQQMVYESIQARIHEFVLDSKIEIHILGGEPCRDFTRGAARWLAEAEELTLSGHGVPNPPEDELSLDPVDEILTAAAITAINFEQDATNTYLNEVIRDIKEQFAGVAVNTVDGIQIFEPGET
tara:strand:- start:5840 stop:6223 length:384 start_codon:yes stop_codon:yes gene_type:complete